MWVEQNCRDTIDYIYDAFVGRLPQSCRPTARVLPQLLDLSGALAPGTSWGAVHDDAVTLGLPMLVLLEADRYVSEDICIAALRAHLFGQLATQIHERFDRLDLYPHAELCTILLMLERERDLIIADLCELGGRARLDCSVAQREARDAVLDEEQFISGERAANMEDFVAVCVARSSPAFPAVLAGAAAAGYGIHELGHLHELVVGLCLGSAARDEVCEWFARAQYGRSWLAAVSAGKRERDDAVASMLELAASSFNHAVLAAHALGAAELAEWTRHQAELIEVLLERRGELSGPRMARTLREQLERAAGRLEQRAA